MAHRIYTVTAGDTVRVSRDGVEFIPWLRNFTDGRVGYASCAW